MRCFCSSVPETVDGRDAEGQVGQPAHGGRCVAAGHLLGSDGHLPVASRAAAAVLDVDAKAGQPKLGKAAPGIPLELAAFVGLLGLGRNLAVNEIAQRGLEHLLLFVENQVGHGDLFSF